MRGPSKFDHEHINAIMAGHGDWFSAELLRFLPKADPLNLERFRVMFPEHVALFEHWLRTVPAEVDS